LWKRTVLRLALYPLVVYFGVCLVLWLLENHLMYRPVSYREEWLSPPPGSRAQDVEFDTEDGTRIHAWWCPTADWDPSKGAVLYCHGNHGNVSQWAPAVLPWQRKFGQAVLLFDYPGYGRSAGKPNEASCYAAATAAFDWLVAKQHVRPQDILLCGISLGGGVVTDLATRRDHRALILISTFTSAPDVGKSLFPWLPVRWLMRNRYESLKKIGQCRRPVFIAHGTADQLIPFVQGERLFAAVQGPRGFFRLEGYTHGQAASPGDDFFAALRLFFQENSVRLP
jgi:hypothetical protein